MINAHTIKIISPPPCQLYLPPLFQYKNPADAPATPEMRRVRLRIVSFDTPATPGTRRLRRRTASCDTPAAAQTRQLGGGRQPRQLAHPYALYTCRCGRTCVDAHVLHRPPLAPSQAQWAATRPLRYQRRLGAAETHSADGRGFARLQ
eukprot:156595-Chlamydomonas_euryale.AAC.5